MPQMRRPAEVVAEAVAARAPAVSVVVVASGASVVSARAALWEAVHRFPIRSRGPAWATGPASATGPSSAAVRLSATGPAEVSVGATMPTGETRAGAIGPDWAGARPPQSARAGALTAVRMTTATMVRSTTKPTEHTEAPEHTGHTEPRLT